MNEDFLYSLPDGPELRAWLVAEEQVVERLYVMAESIRSSDPLRGMQVMMLARRRSGELLEVREWLDLL